jgi:DNA-binding NarL/FixJ family response regulator
VARHRPTLLVVDDDDLFRAWVREVLERAGFGVAEAADADEAFEAVERTRPHLVLLDVRLSVTSGYEIHRELSDRYAGSIPVIFVSGERTEPYDRAAGLLLGADDYLAKPVDPDELVARVRRSLRWKGTGHGHVPATAEPFAELTAREREVLTLLASGMTTKQIAKELVITPRTIGTHVQHILGKLGVHSRAQAVAFAHRGGLAEVSAHGAIRSAAASAKRQPAAFGA